MDELNDIKSIWHSAKVDFLPTAAETRRIVGKYRNKRLLRRLALLLFTFFSCLLMLYLLVSRNQSSLAARIGDVCILISCLVLLLPNMRSLGRIYRLNDLSNLEFLQYLGRVQQGYFRFYKTNQVIGLVFNSAGLLLCLFEFVHTSLTAYMIGYGVAALYLLILWFVVRPWSFRRKMKILKANKARLEKIIEQL